MIGCLTALSLLKKKFKVLVIEKENLSIKDTRTLAVNAQSRDFLKNLNLWNDLKKIHELLKVLQNPYDFISHTSIYQSTPSSEENYITYCGT